MPQLDYEEKSIVNDLLARSMLQDRVQSLIVYGKMVYCGSTLNDNKRQHLIVSCRAFSFCNDRRSTVVLSAATEAMIKSATSKALTVQTAISSFHMLQAQPTRLIVLLVASVQPHYSNNCFDAVDDDDNVMLMLMVVNRRSDDYGKCAIVPLIIGCN